MNMETYSGHVRTPQDAIILFEACRNGILPRVQRRLSEKERQSIKSGSVFVWDEQEAGMRRWTDGKSWSASRVSGSFLTYREMEGKRGGAGGAGGGGGYSGSKGGTRTPDSSRGESEMDANGAGDEGPDGYRYKADGLMKQSFSITTSQGHHLHLISYYSRSHPSATNLLQPTNDPNLRHIRPTKGMYPESTVHEQQSIPPVTHSPLTNGGYGQAPQMAGYARNAMVHAGYSPQGHPQWPQYPPTSMALQNGYYPYPQGGLPPPGYYPTLPVGYPQNGILPPQGAPLAPMMRQGSGDKSPSELPRTHMNGHQRSTSGGSHPYLPYPANPSPRPAAASLAPTSRVPMASMQPSNRVISEPGSPHQSKIDPRLFQPSPLPQSNSAAPPTDKRTPSPMVPKKSVEQQRTPPRDVAPTSVSSTLPSIGTLVNSAAQAQAQAQSALASEMNANGKRSRSGSYSPGGSKREKGETGPQDIPHDKVGFGEDARALRVLDKVFRT